MGNGNLIVPIERIENIEENIDTLNTNLANQQESIDGLNRNLEWKTASGGNVYVLYNKHNVCVRGNLSNVSVAGFTKDTTIFALPSNVKPKIDMFVTCSILTSAYVQASADGHIVLSSSGSVVLSCNNTLNNNVVVFSAMFPRSWFDITE